jgi:hypothetical protein
MLSITENQAQEYGPRHDVRVGFDVQFSDGKRGMMCLYYPTMDYATVRYPEEIESVKTVVSDLMMDEYHEIIAMQVRCFLRYFSDPIEQYNHIHNWERSFWGLTEL